MTEMQPEMQPPLDILTRQSKELQAVPSAARRRTSFALVLLVISMALFLSVLELTSVSTALPTIVRLIDHFPSTGFLWVGSCYTLAAAAFLPMSGAFAQIFGRRNIILAALLLFSLGSALCGAAHTEAVLLLGRTIQGMGGGGLIALTNIVLADLVPLHQRGKYNGFLGVAYAIASAIGPVVGGSLAQEGQWRWLFFLNLPLCGVVTILIVSFLHLKTPQDSFREKVAKIDWIGNGIIIGSTTSIVIALTWGGVVFSWGSAHILVPLLIGIFALILVFIFDARIAREPALSLKLLGNRMSLSGYLQTFLVQCILIAIVYYLPVYFQACKLDSPTASGVDMLGLALSLAPISIIVGLTIAIFQCYRPQLWIGWAVMMISIGLFSTLRATTPIWHSIGFCILAGCVFGAVYTGTMFPILAPLPVSANAHAISLTMFMRIFGQIWGVAIGGAILQNDLRGSLPEDVLSQLPENGDVAYGSIIIIKNLPPDARIQVQELFGKAMTNFWYAMLALSGAGFLVSLLMADIPMHVYTDDNWGVEGEEKELSVVVQTHLS